MNRAGRSEWIIDEDGEKVLNSKLTILKTLHTVIWAVFVTMIVYILYSGIMNQIGWLTIASIAVILAEGVILFACKWKCPITIVAGRFSDNHEPGFDIFLPKFLAKHNKAIFLTLYAVGIIIVALRLVHWPI